MPQYEEVTSSFRFAPAARSAVAPFHVMRVLAAAARRAESGAPVFNLTAGQPSTPAPAPVLAAARLALEQHVLGYTETPGIAPLRVAIAGHYRDRYALDVDPEQVFVTTGSSGGFLLAFLSAFDVGDRVGLVRPGYPAYRNILQALGCEVVDVPCGPETGYQPTLGMIDQLGLKGLVLASPANPTGTMLTPDELAGMTNYCAAQGIRLISDEIYHGITYTGRSACSWSTDRSGLVINSFSKYFSMTGWRIGWMLVPEDLADPIDALAGNLAICPPALAQYAAISAFQAYDECDGHVTRYAVNSRPARRRTSRPWHRKAGPGRWCVLRLRGRVTSDRRRRKFLRPTARRGRRRGCARSRLRPDRRPSVAADVVRRIDSHDHLGAGGVRRIPPARVTRERALLGVTRNEGSGFVPDVHRNGAGAVLDHHRPSASGRKASSRRVSCRRS